MGSFATWIVVIAIAIGIYVNWPAPTLSKQLTKWKESGKFYFYKNQHQIFYRDAKGKGPTQEILLLIHGFPTSSSDWLKIWDDIDNRFGRIVAPDLLGLGFSEKPSGHNYTIFEQADIIESLSQHLKLKRVHILAHDYGDTVAQELLHRHIERIKNDKKEISLQIKTACLLNGGIFPETHIPKWSQEFLLSSKFKDVFAYLSNQWFFAKELSSTFGEFTPPTREDLDDWWAQLRYNDGHRALANLMQYIAQRRQNRDRWVSALQDTEVPLHFVYGALDPINKHPAFVERYRTLLPLATIDILSDVGHYVHWEAPKQVIQSYFNFLDLNQH